MFLHSLRDVQYEWEKLDSSAGAVELGLFKVATTSGRQVKLCEEDGEGVSERWVSTKALYWYTRQHVKG